MQTCTDIFYHFSLYQCENIAQVATLDRFCTTVHFCTIYSSLLFTSISFGTPYILEWSIFEIFFRFEVPLKKVMPLTEKKILSNF